MKKAKLLLMILGLLIMFPCTANAAQNVNEEGISITNIGTTTANVDWSGVASKYISYGYNVTGTYKVTWWSANRGTNIIIDGGANTSAYLTDLPSGTDCCIEVVPYYYDSEGTVQSGYSAAWFKTDGAWDSSIDYNNDTPSSPSTPQAPQTPQTPQTPVSTTLQTPTITEVKMSGTTLGAVAGNIDPNARKMEWQVIDVKNGNKVIATDTSYSTGNTFYGLKRKIYAIQCRVVGYDNDYNDVYSGWSAKKYIVTQPKVSTSKKYLKKNSITVSFGKIKGVKDYTIYMRKRNSSKWTKVKTTKKNKYKITKFKGKSINLARNSYEFCVVANAKIGGKSVKSNKLEYVYTIYY